VKAAPSVRYLARKLGIDLAAVRGSGPQGRILLDDIEAQLRRTGSGDGQARPPEPKPDYGTPGTRIKLQGLRRRIAEHMALATRTIPHYSYVDECDVTDLVRLRDSLRETFAAAGVKLTYLAFVVKAAAAALREVPLVNSSLDEDSREIVLHDRYDVGIAVATPAGLLVPVVRDAGRKDLAAVARDIDRLSAEARAGKARREDLRGGTFTVTSVGNIGGLFSTPVINHPEAAILGVGKVVKRPVFDENGQVRPADMVYLSLSFDHRIIDGAVGAAFANAVIRRLQSPAALLLPPQL
jgi:pyruvate dehydrogenase E2 component (dihydrolipoamide acetyltransferase)/2-oxoisovalerate dehydrogenase E2 component (dihydrolipoyl transacylase)